MNAASHHPSRDQLVAFGQGRLDGAAAESVAEHVADCDSCCEVLGEVPSDTLADQIRAADADTTVDMRDGKSSTQPAGDRTAIPADLVDHPRYRIVRVLGAGGMGTVFQAEHRIMDRPVALKVINRELTNDPEVVQRFRQEVRAAAKLSHANIVTAHDAEQTGELHFLVMEYVEGIDLSRYVKKKGPLAPGLVAHIGRQVAQGLNHAAQHGMVHRDIKPQNLIITKSGRVQILDFGLARLGRKEPERNVSRDDEDTLRKSAAALTLKGSILGTPDYIAPEQAIDSRNTDIRADIYSLGCTLYFLLTGLPPFPGGSVLNKLLAHQNETAKPIAEIRPEVPDEIIDIVERMMSRLPGDRFATPADVTKGLVPMARSWQKSGGKSVPVVEGAERSLVSPVVIDETRRASVSAGTEPPTRAFGHASQLDTESGSALTRNLKAVVQTRGFVVGAIAVCCLAAALLIDFGGTSEPTERAAALSSDGGTADGIEGGAEGSTDGDSTGAAEPERGSPGTGSDGGIVQRQREAASQLQLDEPVVRIPLDGTTELALVVIPSGEFVMGTTEEQLALLAPLAVAETVDLDELRTFERPVSVTITEPFLIGQTEITAEQFRVFADQWSDRTDAEKSRGWGVQNGRWILAAGYSWKNCGELVLRDDNPVGNVSWNDAQFFCAWLNGQDIDVSDRRVRFRLPVEAEWEYACRAGSADIWFFGDDPSRLSQFAVTRGNGPPRAAPVMRLQPNRLGLYGVLGNQAEWCLDAFGPRDDSVRQVVVDSYFIQTVEQTPTRRRRVQRGGTIGDGPLWLRPACRKGGAPSSPTHGSFRVVAEFVD